MFSIGNNHSGTYYPAALEALPFIIEVALHGDHVVARNCAINILVDLHHFLPDCDDTSCEPRELQKIIQTTISDMAMKNLRNFQALAFDDKRNATLVDSLITAASLVSNNAED